MDRDSDINYNDDEEWEDLDDDDKQVTVDEENAELEGAVEPGRHSLSRSKIYLGLSPKSNMRRNGFKSAAKGGEGGGFLLT